MKHNKLLQCSLVQNKNYNCFNFQLVYKYFRMTFPGNHLLLSTSEMHCYSQITNLNMGLLTSSIFFSFLVVQTNYAHTNLCKSDQILKLSSSGPDHVQVMSRSCSGHVQVMYRSSQYHLHLKSQGLDLELTL